MAAILIERGPFAELLAAFPPARRSAFTGQLVLLHDGAIAHRVEIGRPRRAVAGLPLPAHGGHHRHGLGDTAGHR